MSGNTWHGSMGVVYITQKKKHICICFLAITDEFLVDNIITLNINLHSFDQLFKI